MNGWIIKNLIEDDKLFQAEKNEWNNTIKDEEP